MCSLLDINLLKISRASDDLDKTEYEYSCKASLLLVNFGHLGTKKCGKSSVSDSQSSQIPEFVGEK